MSTYTESQHYPEYKKYLVEFSECIKPVIQASYERFTSKLPNVGQPLDSYCLAERKKVEHYRNLIRNEINK